MGILYLVSTPIGNRADISLRALETLKKTEILLCEDTRKTKMLLEFYEIFGPQLVSYYEPVEEAKIPQVIEWLKDGKIISLVSNAGTPLISDPGFKLVRECVRQKIKVEAIPGASALLAALTISGLPTDKFTFLGFLPKKDGKKEKLLKEIKYTTIAYESPYRLVKTLEMLNKLMAEAEVVICRELTKKFEETLRGKPRELIDQLAKGSLKGEVVLVISLQGLTL
ncbi:MAG: 16S rRNA (cytidine(1402)-2'-O)-methyltransferase [Patescibacteria group bacterium]